MKRSRGQREHPHLLNRGIDNRGVPVTLVDRRVCAEHVEISCALDVPDPRAFTPLKHNRERVVVMRAEMVDLCKEALGLGHCGCAHDHILSVHVKAANREYVCLCVITE